MNARPMDPAEIADAPVRRFDVASTDLSGPQGYPGRGRSILLFDNDLFRQLGRMSTATNAAIIEKDIPHHVDPAKRHSSSWGTQAQAGPRFATDMQGEYR